MALRSAFSRVAHAMATPRSEAYRARTASAAVAHLLPGGARRSASILTRPPHARPAATWHLSSDRQRPGPLPAASVARFFDDGFLYIPSFYGQTQLQAVQVSVRPHAAGAVLHLIQPHSILAQLSIVTVQFGALFWFIVHLLQRKDWFAVSWHGCVITRPPLGHVTIVAVYPHGSHPLAHPRPDAMRSCSYTFVHLSSCHRQLCKPCG